MRYLSLGSLVEAGSCVNSICYNQEVKKYAVRDEIPDKAHEALADYPALLKKLLFYRGIQNSESATDFLNFDYQKHLHDPDLLKDMSKAVARILKALELNEKIIIFGDYDADGIPGGVILHDFFKKIGFENFINYIPHRHNEGFGLNESAVKQFLQAEAKLLITIDCGIANVSEINLAQENGLDVIVTDHHLVNGNGVPKAFAIVNPNQPGCKYPNKSLCGAGVVFKLVQALLKSLPQLQTTNHKLSTIPAGWEKWLLDMAGLATLSDMVPLIGENRAIAHYGMKVLRKSPRVGLMKLLRKLKINQRELTEDDVGFMITPRINAASRMGEPMDAFRLFATTDEIEADQVSDHLNKVNDERKGVVASMVKEMKHTVKERYLEKPKVIVLGNPNWRPSLLGLAANTLAEEHICPVFLWGRDGENIIKGSCRSDGETSLSEMMASVSGGIFLEYGGHHFSGGFSVIAEKVHLLEEELVRAYERARENLEATSKQVEMIDARLSLNDVDWSSWNLINQLSPFGVGNPKPLFLFESVKLHEAKLFGKLKNHLELTFKKNNNEKVKAIGFFMKPEQFKTKLISGEKINLVATMERSTFRNFPELRLRIVDII